MLNVKRQFIFAEDTFHIQLRITWNFQMDSLRGLHRRK